MLNMIRWLRFILLSPFLPHLKEGVSWRKKDEGLTPMEWQSNSMYEVCTDIFPRKVSAEKDFLESVSPVLNSFFSFLAEKGYQKSAAKMPKDVKPLCANIVAATQDPSNWGMAKSFFMAGESSGFDMSNPSQASAFAAAHNLATAASRLSSSVSSPRIDKAKKQKRKAQRSARKKNR